MATIRLDTGSVHTSSTVPLQENSIRRSPFPVIRWGAVLAGLAVGLSVQLVLTLLGVASGLAVTNVTAGEAPGTGTLIWAAISMLISAVAGSYVAGRMSGLKRKADGALYGFVCWAVTTLLFVMLTSVASGALLSGMLLSQNPLSMAGNTQSIPGILSRQLGTNISAENMKALQEHIAAGRREEAIRYMQGSMGVQPDKAATMVDQALILSGSPEQASLEGRAAADRTIRQASMLAWSAFGVVVLTLICSLAGGIWGAIGARRIPWTEGMAGVVSKPA